MASTAGHSHRSKLCAGAASSSSAAEPMRHTTRHSPFVDEDDGDDMDPGAVTDLLSRLEALDGDAPAPATAPPARAAAGSPFRSGVRNFARLDHDDDDDDDGGDDDDVDDTDERRQTTDDRRQTIDGRQRTTDDDGRSTTDNGRRTTDERRPTTTTIDY